MSGPRMTDAQRQTLKSAPDFLRLVAWFHANNNADITAAKLEAIAQALEAWGKEENP